MSGEPTEALVGGRRRIVSVNGAKLAVFEYGLAPGPGVASVVLLHGYPDDHRMWLPVVEKLAGDFHVIAYDTRNAGESWVDTAGLAPFKIRYLVDDFYAVLSALGVPRAHIAAHDWGSVQAWAVVRDERAEQAVASLVSVSGPDTAHLKRWYRDRLSRPATVPQALKQFAKSWYIWLFQVPKLPELAVPGIISRLPAGYDRGSNAQRGIALYRANVGVRKVRRPVGLAPAGAVLRKETAVPVLLVKPLGDKYVSPDLAEGVSAWASHLEQKPVPGDHWWPARQPAAFATLVTDWIERHD